MKDQFIPYELALKLKELGFNGECIKGFYEGEPIYTIVSTPVDFNNKKQLGELVSAPLWQQSFDWFRDKGYGAFVETWINGGVKKFRGRNNYAPLFITDVFDTYEEARQACLEKLIELCKKK